MKVGQVIRQAFLLLRTFDAQQDRDPIDDADALLALNDLMAQWESEPLPLGWVPVSNNDQDMPTQPEANRAIYYGLAMALAEQYGAIPSQQAVDEAAAAKALLKANYVSNTVEVCDYSDLPRGQGQRVGYSWRDGYYR